MSGITPSQEKRARDVREALIAVMSEIPDKEIAVGLSAGVDSFSVMCAALEAGKSVTAYSFTVDGWASRDWTMARRNAKAVGVPFRSVLIMKDQDQMLKDLAHLASIGCVRKTQFECCWCMMKVTDAVAERTLAIGVGCDSYFCLSKKAMIHMRHSVELMDQHRTRSTQTSAKERAILNAHAETLGKVVETPLQHQRFREILFGTTWEELNRPQEKLPLHMAFPEYRSKVRIYPHTNFQCGDSKIQPMFESLLEHPLVKPHGFKSPIALYNAIRKGVIKP